MFVNGALAPRFLRQISFRGGFSADPFQTTSCCQNAIHRPTSFSFHRSLIFNIDSLYRLLGHQARSAPAYRLHRYQTKLLASKRRRNICSVGGKWAARHQSFFHVNIKSSLSSSVLPHVVQIHPSLDNLSRFPNPLALLPLPGLIVLRRANPRLPETHSKIAISSSLGLLPM